MRDYHVEEREDLPYKVLVDRPQVRSRPRARADGPQAHLQAGPPDLRRQGSPSARPRRHGNCNPVHVPRRDHEPHRRARRHRRRSDLFRLVTAHVSRIGRQPIEVPAGVTVTIDPGRVTVHGPKGELRQQVPLRIVDRAERRHDQRHAPDRPRPRPLAPRPHAHARREHGRGRHERLREAPRDPGRRLPRRACRARTSSSRSATRTPSGSRRARASSSRCPCRPRSIVRGIDKQVVGQTAAEIRKVRPPEPYKGKGIRYEGEHVRRKVGKRA